MVVGSTIIVPSTEENSDFMNLTSISDVNILQTEDEEEAKEEAPKEDERKPQELKTFITKDDLLREGLTVCNSQHISLIEVYLMLGKPAKLGFVYGFVGEKSQKWKTSSMLNKLVMVARSEFNMATEMSRKFVSVGTNTSPVKEATATPQLFRNPSQEINITYKADSAAPILAQNGQLTLHLNPGTTLDVGQEKMKEFQFARPLAPAPIPVMNTRLTNSTLATTDGNTVNLNPSSILLPKGRKRGRPAAVVSRILVPSSVSSKTTSQLFREQYQSLYRGNSRLRPIMPNNKIIGKLVNAVPAVNTVAITKAGIQVNDIISQAAMRANITTSPLKPGPGPSNIINGFRQQKALVHNNNHQEVIGLAPLTGRSTPTPLGNNSVIFSQSAMVTPTTLANNSVISSQSAMVTPTTLANNSVISSQSAMVTPTTLANNSVISSQSAMVAPTTLANNSVISSQSAMVAPTTLANNSVISSQSAMVTPTTLANNSVISSQSAMVTPTTLANNSVISIQSAMVTPTTLANNSVISSQPAITECDAVSNRPSPEVTTPSKYVSGEPLSPKANLLSLDDHLSARMSTPKASHEGVLDRSLLNTPVIQDKHSSPTNAALNISPPNLSSLLDISMSSIEGAGSSQDGLLSGFRERLQELTKETDAANSVAAALSTATVSVPKGGGHSPFKIGGEVQWLHEESSQNTEMSLGSLLDQLEMMPEKKGALSIPPPVVLADGSRDSVMSRDMDAHLQAMLNENSLDYVAKFADLAAHIAATGSEEGDPMTTAVLQTVAR